MQTLKASMTPQSDIQKVAYAGQNPLLRQWRGGFERYMDTLPVLVESDPLLDAKADFTRTVMESLATELRDQRWIYEKVMNVNTFERTILAIEAPKVQEGVLTEGAEIIVAQWGAGFASHVHGHAPGYLLETILSGRGMVNTYRMVDSQSSTVRPVRTDIVSVGTFASVFNPVNKSTPFKRSALIHNFVALETTSTLHFLPEHTRDARDNGFTPEFFEDVHHLSHADVHPITAQQGMYLQKGEVVLVRSSNVPDLGDHYIVITGHPIVKEHGLRPQDIAIQAPHAGPVLDLYPGPLTLLRFDGEAAKRFHEFHCIQMVDGEVVFPNA